MSPGRADTLLWLAFEAAARSHPDAVAFLDGADSVTYEQLHGRARTHTDRLRTALTKTDAHSDEHAPLSRSLPWTTARRWSGCSGP